MRQHLPEVGCQNSRPEIFETGGKFDFLAHARALVHGDALAVFADGHSVGAVAAFDALAPAVGVGGYVVARPGARVGARLIHLAAGAVSA